MKIKGLYCILPEFETISEYENFVTRLVKYQPDVVQLRIKYKPDKFFYNVAVKVKNILSKTQIVFIIDDRVDIAVSVGANGVHLGQDDLQPNLVRKLVNKYKIKNFIIGYSTHSFSQARDALKLPVDYISIGPVFATTSKPEYKPVGLETVRKVKKIASKKNIPVVAIGGINHTNVELVKKQGVDAIAVISAIRDLNPEVIFKLKYKT